MHIFKQETLSVDYPLKEKDNIDVARWIQDMIAREHHHLQLSFLCQMTGQPHDHSMASVQVKQNDTATEIWGLYQSWAYQNYYLRSS